MIDLKQEKFIISEIILIFIVGKCCSHLPYSLPDSSACQVVAEENVFFESVHCQGEGAIAQLVKAHKEFSI